MQLLYFSLNINITQFWLDCFLVCDWSRKSKLLFDKIKTYFTVLLFII